jgi:NAD(P)-dependent dehydrogenase (short-subunit alcohol dehydrogenase family)
LVFQQDNHQPSQLYIQTIMALNFNKLRDAHVLVIGGTSGIGFGVAQAALSAGAEKVTISSSNAQRVQSRVKEIQQIYPTRTVQGETCDLSGEDIEEQLEALFKKIGEVNHIVFTAGDALAMKGIADWDLKFIHAAGQVRFVAPLLVAKIGSKYLPKSASSSIIFTGGSVAEHPMPNWSVVASYSSGLHGMTRNLALDLKPVRVNLVQPGAVDTDLWKGMGEEGRKAMFDGLAKTLPTGRPPTVEDVAEAYVYFMKDRNATGQIVRTDGGHSLL